MASPRDSREGNTCHWLRHYNDKEVTSCVGFISVIMSLLDL
jgi:hypothetical protein